MGSLTCHVKCGGSLTHANLTSMTYIICSNIGLMSLSPTMLSRKTASSVSASTKGPGHPSKDN